MHVQGETGLENEDGEKDVEDEVTIEVSSPSDGPTGRVDNLGPQFGEKTGGMTGMVRIPMARMPAMGAIEAVERSHGQTHEKEKDGEGKGHFLQKVTRSRSDDERHD